MDNCPTDRLVADCACDFTNNTKADISTVNATSPNIHRVDILGAVTVVSAESDIIQPSFNWNQI